MTDDLISELIRAEDDRGDKLDHDELLSLAMALLGAGTDTTRHQLAAAVDLFCDHPDQWALLGEQPELAPRAVEEVMRYRPISFALVECGVQSGGGFVEDQQRRTGEQFHGHRCAFALPARQFVDPRRSVLSQLQFGKHAGHYKGTKIADLGKTTALRKVDWFNPSIAHQCLRR